MKTNIYKTLLRWKARNTPNFTSWHVMIIFAYGAVPIQSFDQWILIFLIAIFAIWLSCIEEKVAEMTDITYNQEKDV